MRIVALILILFVFKAGTALPVTSTEWDLIQLTLELSDYNENSTDCCDDDEQGCCNSGLCCCISIGGLTMTFHEINRSESINWDIIQDRTFVYRFSYHMNFNNAVFQPPKLA